MYILKIKDDERTLETSTIGSLLFIYAFIVWAARASNNLIVSIIVSAILVLASLFVRTLLLKFKFNRLLIIFVAALLVLIAVHSLPFFILILLPGFVIHTSYIKPVVEVYPEQVRIKKTFSNKLYEWQSFNNIILKDNLLTLDFKNNKVLQLEIEEGPMDENAFNDFCALHLIQ